MNGDRNDEPSRGWRKPFPTLKRSNRLRSQTRTPDETELALRASIEQRMAVFWSTSRNELWLKGETSGNKLEVVEIFTDCDDDTVLVKVKRLGDGNVCHTGTRSCFTQTLHHTTHEEHKGAVG